MCDQRERLIGYVYDECEPGERAQVQEHLESCATCRTEIAALRSVRDDLQTWQIPDHESVWRPFAPAPAPAWWSQVPRWAVAAAAGAVIVSGAAGGALASAVMSRSQPVLAAAGVTQAGPVLTHRDLDELERRIDAKFQAEVNQLNGRVQLAGSRPVSPDVEATLHKTFDTQLLELRATSDRQLDVINGIYNQLGQIQKGFDTRHALLANDVKGLQQLVLSPGR